MTDISPDSTLVPLAETIQNIGRSTDSEDTKVLAAIAAILVTLVAEVGRLRKAVQEGYSL